MVLGDMDIRSLAKKGLVYPYKEENVQPASYDCTLGYGFLVPEKMDRVVNLSDCSTYLPISEYGIHLGAGDFCLGTTDEVISVPQGVYAEVKGRSSIGRLGLFVENAGVIDPGFNGQITLELYNAGKNTLFLEPGARICQIVFHQTSGTSFGYQGKYQNQAGVQGSLIHKDFQQGVR